MDGLFEDIKKQAEDLHEFLNNDALDIIAIEGINHIEESYENEGFTDQGVEKWTPRKTTNKKGRDLTKYRTNRKGKAGDLTRFGRKNKDRKILTGTGSGGNKMRNSWRSEKGADSVYFGNDKEYVERHNEGLDGMPKRKQAGKSKELDKKTHKKIHKEINKIMKR